MSFLIVFIFCLLTSLYFCSIGILGNKFIYKIKGLNNVLEYCILGIFSVSFLALFLNFFVSLNVYLNSIIFIASITYLFFLEKNLLIKILKYCFIISLISFLTIILDHTNRPDSGLYHLPYISLLNENKLIIGSANLNERFGIISIIQYLSAINFNFLFSENGILIPLVIIYALSLIFFFIKFFNNKNNYKIRILAFLFFIFILLNLNRYSGFGNDAPTHLFYFILIFYFLECNNEKNANKGFQILTIISVYIFLIKSFFILLLILPLIFFFNNSKDIKIFNTAIYVSFFFILIWFIKNILVTGCILYPLNLTCISNLDWTLNPSFISIEAEAWTKGWPDRINKNLSYEEYLKDFNWVSTWLNNHLKIILSKLLPFFFILVLLSAIIIFKNIKQKKIIEKRYYQLIIFNFLFLIIWLNTFPNYRFGLGIMCVIISISFLSIFKNRISLENKLFNKSLVFFIILTSLIITLKNIDRIKNKYEIKYVDYPWPRKNSHYLSNKKLANIAIMNRGEKIYYTTPKGELCFYSKSPCTHINNLKIKKTKYLKFYEKYSIDK